MSFGVASIDLRSYPDDETFLKVAEDYMYMAKRQGKNRVCGE